MSFTLMAWANQQTTGSGTRKAVLLALADRANADTGRCCPSVELIAEQTEFSVRTVQTALVDLCNAGLVSRERRRRSDGSLAGYHYTFPTAAAAPPPAAAAASPPAGAAGQEEPGSTSSEPGVELVATAAAAPGKELGTVDRLPVSDDHAQLAHAVLAAWNEASGQSLTAVDWLRKIVMRIRERPTFTLDDHRHLIADALAHPWWKGPADPGVVYGNGAQFERCITRAQQGHGGGATPRRYGTGMTTAEILSATQGDDGGPAPAGGSSHPVVDQ